MLVPNVNLTLDIFSRLVTEELRMLFFLSSALTALYGLV